MNNLLPNAVYTGAGEHLFMSEELSNLTILVKDKDQIQWRFPAHRLILATQSAVFRVMLENEFSEKTTGEIIIEDVKPHIVKMLLEYIYCGRATLENWLDALELLRAAHKYQMDPLVQHCARFLESVITIGNVCSIYNDTCLYALIPLKEKCLKLILDAAFVVLRSKAFEILSKEAVMEIITNRELNIDSELMVFDALQRWATVQCCRLSLPVSEENTLKELTPFLKYVCFDDMSDTEKSSLGAVLSCVKPNNRNRITYHVSDSLLKYAHFFNFHANQDLVGCIGNELNCIRFSLDASAYLIGLKFMVVMSQIPDHLCLLLVKEAAGSSNMLFDMNMHRAIWKEGLQINERKRWETHALLRHPHIIEEKCVYKLSVVDQSKNAFCPKTYILNKTLHTEEGHVNISLHCENVLGVMGLIFL